jgi:hypothetical protein
MPHVVLVARRDERRVCTAPCTSRSCAGARGWSSLATTRCANRGARTAQHARELSVEQSSTITTSRSTPTCASSESSCVTQESLAVVDTQGHRHARQGAGRRRGARMRRGHGFRGRKGRGASKLHSEPAVIGEISPNPIGRCLLSVPEGAVDVTAVQKLRGVIVSGQWEWHAPCVRWRTDCGTFRAAMRPRRLSHPAWDS